MGRPALKVSLPTLFTRSDMCCYKDTGYVISVVVCPQGFYGAGCSRRCDCASIPCDPVKGTCICETGWTGQRCDLRKNRNVCV